MTVTWSTTENTVTWTSTEDPSIVFRYVRGGTVTGAGVSSLADLTDVDVTTDPPDTDDVLAWDGTDWTPATLTAVELSDATPQDLGTAAAGVGTTAARSDHVHDMPSAADVGADPAGSADAAQTYSVQRGNHTGTQAISSITGLDVRLPLVADRSLHIITNDTYPIAEVNPADDLATWEAADAGPDFWGVPTTGVSRLLIHDEIDRTLSGVWEYDADAGTIERASDADTTAKLHDKLVLTTTNRERSGGGVATDPDYRPIPTWIRAADPTDAIGTAEWHCVELIDTETFNTVTAFLQTQITTGTGYPVATNLVMATAVDGTATNLDVIFPNEGTGEQSVPDSDDFYTVVTLPVATVVALFGESIVLVPYGANLGVYQLKASGPWTSFEKVGGDVMMVLAGTVTGQPALWQGVNDRGDGAIDTANAPTGWVPFSLTPAEGYLRRVAAQVRYTAADAADWNGSAPSTVAAALDRIAAALGPIT